MHPGRDPHAVGLCYIRRMNTDTPKRPLGTRWCRVGIWLGIIAAVATIVGILGGRTGLLSGLNAFMSFGIGGLLFFVGIIVTLIGLLLSKGTAGDASATQSLAVILVGAAVIGGAAATMPDTSGAPAIHDLTTDLESPPEFVAILPLRAAAPNPPEYLDDGTAQQQREAFPDLVTLHVNGSIDEVFAAAEQAVGDMGWELVAADPAAGRIEATETTEWFGFKDDVVVRITGDTNSAAVDVRSKSRVGRGDMGANERRIREYLDILRAKIGN